MSPRIFAILKAVLSLIFAVVIGPSYKVNEITQKGTVNLLSSAYSVEQVIVGSAIEYRFILDHHHFAPIIDQQGTYAFRPHPGCDINGWGTTFYAQPFLPGAILKNTLIGPITSDANGIHVIASGMVSQGVLLTYGTWGSVINYTFDPVAQVINGSGTYTITLSALLSDNTGDLNLYKLASNYLPDVPLIPSGIGDTGDMKEADVQGDYFSFVWIPPNQPSHFPTDKTDALSIEVVGQFNNVDTQRLGYPPIAPAFKPSLMVILTSHKANTGIMFGGIYDLAENQCFYCDNVGITPIILRTSPDIEFNFDIEIRSEALETCTYTPIIMKQ